MSNFFTSAYTFIILQEKQRGGLLQPNIRMPIPMPPMFTLCTIVKDSTFNFIDFFKTMLHPLISILTVVLKKLNNTHHNVLYIVLQMENFLFGRFLIDFS